MELPTNITSTNLADGDVAIRFLHEQEKIRRARSKRRWIAAGAILAGMFVLMVGCGLAVGAAASGGSSASTTATPARVPAPVVYAPSTPDLPGEAIAPSAATTAPTTPETEPAPVGPFPPAAAFGNGAWLVGDEVAAGTYRSAGPSEDTIKMCYVDSKAGDKIVSQEVSADGPVRITVTDGQVVKASGCQQFVLTS